MAGKSKYTDEDRARVNAELTISDGNVKQTSRNTNVPEATVRLWKKRWETDGIPAEVAVRTNEAVEKFLDDAQHVRAEATAKIRDALPHIVLKNANDVKALATVVGIYDDKITRVNVRPAQINQTNIVLADSREIQERFQGYIQNMLSASRERDSDIESSVVEVE